MLRGLLVPLLLVCCMAPMSGSAQTAEAHHCGELAPSCTHPGAAAPPEGEPRYLRRAQATLDEARRRLLRAESDRSVADSRRLGLVQSASAGRRRASQLRRHAAGARRRANTAEKQMVDQRRDALEQVRAGRAAYNVELLNWFGNRASAFAVAVWLLLMASLAAGWRPMLAWLALRRAGGLDRAAYAMAVVVAAAIVTGGAVAASALSPALTGVLAPVAFPLIAAMVMLLGLTAWRSTDVRAGSAGVPKALMNRGAGPGMPVVLTLVTGVGIGLIGFAEGEPAEPRVAPKTAALARLAEPDPSARPTERVTRLREKADRAEGSARRAELRVTTVEDMLRGSEEDVRAADRMVSEARRAVNQWRQRVDRLRRRG